jgi:hypothetical protein
MEKSLIREMFLKSERRVYSIIMLTYGMKFLEYKPKMFKKWLAAELDVPEEKINTSSLNSSFARYRKTVESRYNKQFAGSAALPATVAPAVVVAPIPTVKNGSKENKWEKKEFVFSDPNAIPPKPRIEEF